MVSPRRFYALAPCRTGSAALEFAIVSIPFFGLLLGAVSVALDFYLQFALDYALQQAVRQVQLGLVPQSTSAGDFTGDVFCPAFAVFAPCSGVLISLQPVNDYTAAPVSAPAQSASFCTGQPGQLMYARAVYQAPLLQTIIAAAAPAGPGSSGSTLVATAAFANENPSGTAPTATAGC